MFYNDLDEKQNIITTRTSSTTGNVSVPSGTVTTLRILSVTTGKYIIFGSAAIVASSYDTKLSMKICISTSTSFNNDNAGGVVTEPAFAAAMNCWAILDIYGDMNIYLLAYHACDASSDNNKVRTAQNIKLQAIKID